MSKELSRTERFQQLFNLLNELRLVPGSEFFSFLKRETHSPASNACWLKRDNFCYHMVVDNLLAHEGWEPGCSVSYGYLDHDRGTSHLVNTAGCLKFNPKDADDDEAEGYADTDDAEAARVLMGLLLDYEAKFKISKI